MKKVKFETGEWCVLPYNRENRYYKSDIVKRYKQLNAAEKYKEKLNSNVNFNIEPGFTVRNINQLHSL